MGVTNFCTFLGLVSGRALKERLAFLDVFCVWLGGKGEPAIQGFAVLEAASPNSWIGGDGNSMRTTPCFLF